MSAWRLYYCMIRSRVRPPDLLFPLVLVLVLNRPINYSGSSSKACLTWKLLSPKAKYAQSGIPLEAVHNNKCHRVQGAIKWYFWSGPCVIQQLTSPSGSELPAVFAASVWTGQPALNLLPAALAFAFATLATSRESLLSTDIGNADVALKNDGSTLLAFHNPSRYFMPAHRLYGTSRWSQQGWSCHAWATPSIHASTQVEA